MAAVKMAWRKKAAFQCLSSWRCFHAALATLASVETIANSGAVYKMCYLIYVTVCDTIVSRFQPRSVLGFHPVWHQPTISIQALIKLPVECLKKLPLGGHGCTIWSFDLQIRWGRSRPDPF